MPLDTGLAQIPPERHLHILYEELVTNPRAVTQQIINRIPHLGSLDFAASGGTAGVMNKAFQDKIPSVVNHKSVHVLV